MALPIKRLLPFALLGLFANLHGAEKTSVDPEISRELLAHHTTIARFDGIQHRRCVFLTAECPDACDHSKTFATFTILSYLTHEAPSEYGKDQASTFAFALDGHGAETKRAIIESLKNLQPGDTVTLSWNHDYITTQGGSRYPERPVLLLQKGVLSLVELAQQAEESVPQEKKPSMRNRRSKK